MAYEIQKADVHDAISEIKRNPLLHEQVVEEFYKQHGKHWLEVLSTFLLVEKGFEGNSPAEKYIDKKLIEILKKEELELQQLEFDVKNKKRQIKWFYPLLIGSFIAAVFSIISILSELKVIDLSKFQINKEIKK